MLNYTANKYLLYFYITDADQNYKEKYKIVFQNYCRLVIMNRGIYKPATIAKHFLKFTDEYDVIIQKSINELSKDNKELTLYELFFYLAEKYLQTENPIGVNEMDVINIKLVIYIATKKKENNNDKNLGSFL